jgi:hypothetical protein
MNAAATAGSFMQIVGTFRPGGGVQAPELLLPWTPERMRRKPQGALRQDSARSLSTCIQRWRYRWRAAGLLEMTTTAIGCFQITAATSLEGLAGPDAARSAPGWPRSSAPSPIHELG